MDDMSVRAEKAHQIRYILNDQQQDEGARPLDKAFDTLFEEAWKEYSITRHRATGADSTSTGGQE